jgi:exodeoxyribonuclease III
MQKICTWNINGIRAAINKDLYQKISTLDCDMFCLQEIKADSSIMTNDIKPPIDYWIASHSCTIKKGYSGVAILGKKLTTINPQTEELDLFDKINSSSCSSSDNILSTSLGKSEFDQEGRYIEYKFNYTTKDQELIKVALLNCYYPQGGRDYRIPFKIDFYKQILNKTKDLKKQGFAVILTGDFNTTFGDIDLARPASNRKTTGCLPIEREALNSLIDTGLYDAFRDLYPNKEGCYTYWDQITRSRDRNIGWRIDMFLVDKKLKQYVVDVVIKSDIMGSDHCPVVLVLK